MTHALAIQRLVDRLAGEDQASSVWIGLFQFTWDASAFARVNAGFFTVKFEEYDGDPFNGGVLQDALVAFDAPYIAFTAPAPTADPSLPEPATLVLALTGLAGVVRRRVRN